MLFMVKYKKVYFDYYRYGEQDTIQCEICNQRAVDIHHIEPKKMGGSKNKDVIENLMALCRECHTSAHNNFYSKKYLKEIHLSNLIK